VYFEQSECYSNLKTLRGRQYYFQKLTQFSYGNNVQDPPASNIDGFHPRDTWVSTIQLYRTMVNKVNVFVT
jgi:hypothetical protein